MDPEVIRQVSQFDPLGPEGQVPNNRSQKEASSINPQQMDIQPCESVASPPNSSIPAFFLQEPH